MMISSHKIDVLAVFGYFFFENREFSQNAQVLNSGHLCGNISIKTFSASNEARLGQYIGYIPQTKCWIAIIRIF